MPVFTEDGLNQCTFRCQWGLCMDSHQQATTAASDRPSFLGLPAGWRVWSQAGGQFWAGVLIGVGIGLLVAAGLVELELMTLHRKAWVSVTGIILCLLGQAAFRWTAKRQRQGQGDQGQKEPS